MINQMKIIENFLDEEDLNNLKSLKLNSVPSKEIKVYHNQIDKNNVVTRSCVDVNLIKKLHEKYHDKALNILKTLSPEKAKIYDYSDFEIIETGKDYKFPIHDDTPNKLLSGVIYLYPKKNVGTIFYKNKYGDNKKEIEWKENRGVFFSRIDRESWHSFRGDGNSNRVALVYNLNTLKIREVYNIEKKNYYIGMLRWKINPYLLRFFKTTI